MEALKKNVEVYQLVIAIMLVLGGVFTSWIDINSRISIIETKEIYNDALIQKVDAQLLEIQNTQTQILVELQNKENR